MTTEQMIEEAAEAIGAVFHDAPAQRCRWAARLVVAAVLAETRRSIAPAFENLADLHHRTLAGSAKHNPARVDSFRDCSCLSCREATKALAALHVDGRRYS